jgi:hypothetical protein
VERVPAPGREDERGRRRTVFELDLGDPKTLWLTITNIVLGVLTLLCFVVVLWGATTASLARLRKRWGFGLEPDDHLFVAPGLGMTMADGGKKLNGNKKA